MKEEPLHVRLAVRELIEFVLRCGSIDSRFAGFDRMNEGSRIHRKLQKAAGERYQAEVAFKAERTVDNIVYTLEGRADGVIAGDDGGYTIDEIKTTGAPAELLTADWNPLHWAQAKCYGAFLCEREHLAGVRIQITYYQIDTDEIIRHWRDFSAGELETFLTDTLHAYARWAKMTAEWRDVRDASMKALHFPFPAYRRGQYELACAVYRTIANGAQGKASQRLFCTAPTGIGKTMSTLFPALKALGEGKGERVFYLTAKTVTRQAAQDALAKLRVHSEASGVPMRLRAVTLTAKDKICPLEQRDCTPQSCPRADGYYDRVNDALFAFLRQSDLYTREAIEAYAERHHLCPFEFALDLTNWCDCVICDYNYLFDPVVSLKRFFTEGGDFIFLVDEAHNLVDRARDMYSAELKKSDIFALKKQMGKTHRKLSGALGKVNQAMVSLRRRCEEAKVRVLRVPEGLDELNAQLRRLSCACEDWLEEHRDGAAQSDVLALYFDVRFYLRVSEWYGENYTTLVSLRGQDVTVRQLCLDASPYLDASFSLGRAGVLFSATLSPLDYFIRTLGGGKNARAVRLPSPFIPERLCVAVADTVSTKYADRERTREDVCRLIGAAVSARAGNYLVFLPSYQYLADVSDEFSMMFPDIPLAVQESGMDEAARAGFLSQFTVPEQGICAGADAGTQNRPAQETLVGFCVLGGVFSEGIDLVGDRLIGSIVVGVGLPQIGPEQDALRDYYETQDGMGFSYAYQYPGMNKVLQAAGRVIRTETDRGVLLLIDSRYRQASYRKLLPPHWAHAKRVENAEQLTRLLTDFWGACESQDIS